MNPIEAAHVDSEQVLRDADEWASQRLRQASTPHTYICSSCRAIDFAKGIQCAEQYRLDSDTILCERQQLDVNCAVCHLLSRYVFPSKPNCYEVRPQLSLRLSPWALRCLIIDSQTSCSFRPLPRALLYPGNGPIDLRMHRNDAKAAPRGYLVVTKTSPLEEYIRNPEISDGPRTHLQQPTYNPALIKSWMQYSGIKSLSTFVPFNISGMWLIDCEEFIVVERQDDMPYLALSYVWALANNDSVPLGSRGDKAMDNPVAVGHLPSLIPRVVANAMTVTIDLGYRYLWVDQFCIDQKAGIEAVMDHVSRMDQIYMSAQLTIIAASTCGALPGVMDTPRILQELLNVPAPRGRSPEEGAPLDNDDPDSFTLFTTSPYVYENIQSTVWYQRGWCFQESVLSSARLYFTDYETLFQTRDIAFSETFPEDHEVLDTTRDSSLESLSLVEGSWKKRLRGQWTRDMYSLRDPRGQFWAGLCLLAQLLKVYTGKDLTKELDSVNGFRGVLRFFARMIPGFVVIAGVPLYLPGSTVRSQTFALGDKPNRMGVENCEGHSDPQNSEVLQRNGPICSSVEQPQLHSGMAASPSPYGKTSAMPSIQTNCHFQHQCLTAMLLWRHYCSDEKESAVLERRLGFPSWSWAGWKGQVSWYGGATTMSIRRNGDDSNEEDDDDDDDDEEDDDDDEEDDDDDEEDDDDDEEDDDDDEEDDDDDEEEEEEEEEDDDNEDNMESTDAPIPCPPSYGWQIKALELNDGRVIPLSQDPIANDHITTLTASQLDSVTHLIGEAFILPSSSIVLTHTASNMRDVSRAYRIARVVEKSLRETFSCFEKLRDYTMPHVRKLARSIPWLGFYLQFGGDTRSTGVLRPWAMARPFMRGLYHFSYYFRFSKLRGLLQKLHATAVYLSIAELARLSQNSLLLEQDVRARLDDGLWGLLVVDATNCLVVEWHIDADRPKETGSASIAMNDGCDGINRKVRHCSRVGVLEFHHYLYSGPEVEMDMAAIFSSADKVQFRLA